ncbi:blue copper protein-like [Eucalyptus grandis]|uniref:blue copper protein-like n=1 Tax=Eucalyptus grandis TaxID=71139 RepID=UPI00192EE6E7|nr:blue copper protein-like [Eucalyptus grandis]
MAPASVTAIMALLLGSAAQTLAPPPEHPKGTVTYTVGDIMGWTIPASGAAAYRAWASSNNFEVGDILVFNFNNGAQDLAEVTETAFGSCDGANPLSISTVPPARIALTTAGQHFFLCTVPGHCSSGQKVAINVTTASSSATPPPPSSSAAPPPKAATPSPSASTPTSSATNPTPSPSASTSSSSTVSPPNGTVTPTPSTVSLPPKAATPSLSATPLPSSTAAPPSSVPAPSVVAASPTGDAVHPAPGNSAASLSITGVSAVILTAAVALFTFP